MALLLSVITALGFICIAFADLSPLQDLCVADLTSTERINGLPCKDPATIQVNDFLFQGFHLPAAVSNRFIPIAFKFVDVNAVPGLNTQGLSLVRFDLEKHAFIPPHDHSRASEVMWVESGSVEAGFVSFGKQYSTILNEGDVFVFPNALVHYFRNVANNESVVISVFNSQNPGLGMGTPRNYWP